MKIEHTRVYNAGYAVVVSGLPMAMDYNPEEFARRVEQAEADFHSGNTASGDMRRAGRLASCGLGKGEDNFLNGIMVSMTVTAPIAWWPQMQRYHFAEITSSQSTVHCIRRILDRSGHDLTGLLARFDGTSGESLEAFIETVDAIEANEKLTDGQKTERIKLNLPGGYLLTAGMYTNYRQLKTIYQQRRHHIMSQWQEFCNWVEQLPMSVWITGTKEN